MISEKEFNQAVINMRTKTCKLEREGEYWTPEEREQLVEMFHEGIGMTKIAVILQRTEVAAMEQAKLLGLYPAFAPKKRSAKRHLRCLCPDCKKDPSFCPHCKAYPETQEAE